MVTGVNLAIEVEHNRFSLESQICGTCALILPLCHGDQGHFHLRTSKKDVRVYHFTLTFPSYFTCPNHDNMTKTLILFYFKGKSQQETIKKRYAA